RGLHMDSRMDHVADIIVNVYKVNYVDVGIENDLSTLVENFNGKVVFNGNADWRVLIGSSPERIRKEVKRCIYAAAPAGGYIFDNSGETYVGVPPENLRYEVEYAKKVGKYPIRRLT
ncbi:MAG: uroporphyrinogen decarboxylase family protein, partial [Candidatus Bathyarchaeia archaeon]